MGSDEPVEQWAGPENLDPTPVWKQYLLVVVLGVAFLAFVGGYVYLAALPDLVTPPAAIPGGRVILAASDYPPGTTKKVALGGGEFYVSDTGRDVFAVLASWAPEPGAVSRCRVTLVGEDPLFDRASPEEVFLDSCTRSAFYANGKRFAGAAPRGLDRYLVSRKGDRLIVNTDHLIQGTP